MYKITSSSTTYGSVYSVFMNMNIPNGSASDKIKSGCLIVFADHIMSFSSFASSTNLIIKYCSNINNGEDDYELFNFENVNIICMQAFTSYVNAHNLINTSETNVTLIKNFIKELKNECNDSNIAFTVNNFIKTCESVFEQDSGSTSVASENNLGFGVAVFSMSGTVTIKQKNDDDNQSIIATSFKLEASNVVGI
ncbi:hypothetical protein AB837_00132 [bacterium AB1]|nr:hypothetical protein AB837_00132 [bacterium AB1]